jgi:hypothetical protein
MRPLVWNGPDGLPRAGEETTLWRFVEPQKGETPTHYELPYVAWGNYYGDIVTRANYAAIVRRWGGDVIRARDWFGFETLLVPVRGTLARMPSDLWEVIRRLGDYPLVCEDTLDAVTADLVAECWEGYGAADLREELGGPAESLTNEELFELLRQAWDDSGYSPEAESAVSICLWNRDVLAILCDNA